MLNTMLVRPYTSGSRFEPPLALAYLGGYLKDKGISVKLVDAETLGWDTVRVLEEIRKYKPKIVGVSINTYYRFQGMELVKSIKENFPDIIVMLGGAHVTPTAVETLEDYPFVDIAIVREGEETAYEIAQHADDKKFDDIKGIAFRKGSEVILNPEREFIKDIDVIRPAWELLPMHLYEFHGIFGQRGCPFDCSFCQSPSLWKKKLRLVSPKLFVDQIEYLLETYGNKMVHIKDDTFTANQHWAKDVCEEIQRRNLNFKWECLTRVEAVDKSTLKMLKEAGCNLVEFGIESGSEKILQGVSKGLVLRRVREAVQWAKDVGLTVQTFYMVGHPGETLSTAEETMNLAMELKCMSAFSPTDILPGTGNFYRAIQEGVLPKDFRWSQKKLNLQDWPVPRYINKDLSERQVEDLSKRYSLRLDWYRLFDIENRQELLYFFTNPDVPWHFRVFNRADLVMFFKELFVAFGKAPSTIRKTFGLFVFPFFMTRIGYDYFKRICFASYKRVKRFTVFVYRLFNIPKTKLVSLTTKAKN